MSKAQVLGLGQSGLSAARLLKARGWQVTVSDAGDNARLKQRQAQLRSEGLQVEIAQPLAIAPGIELLVVSPGIPWDLPILKTARAAAIRTIGEVELAWQYLSDRPWIGITGTNGKTTTTALVAAIFQAAGYDAPACGNIGIPICELALAPARPDWVIAELSSYQIESSPTVQPRIGIWTTFTADHLSRHHTLEAYAGIKAHLMQQSQTIVLNGDDPYLAETGPALWPAAIWTSCSPGHVEAVEHGASIHDGWVWFAGDRILSLDRFQLIGEHNRQNLLMAVAAARLAGIAPAAIETAIANFRGVPHRLEYICDRDGVKFINDSKATNYDASLVGLHAIESPLVLVAGGDPKSGDPTAWLTTICEKVKVVLLIGAAAPLFAKLLDDVGYRHYEMVDTLETAVPRSLALAKDLGCQTVLLSPACASFDRYENFEQRGDHFRKLCLELCVPEV